MNWLKYTPLYILLSGILIAVSIYSVIVWGINFGLDFKGGTLTEYSFAEEISTENAISSLEENGIKVQSIQKAEDYTYIFKVQSVSAEEKIKLENIISTLSPNEVLQLRFETVGPSVGPDLIKKTIYAIVLASILILLWIAYQFKNIAFGLSAIFAMFHDSFILIGLFSLLGHYWGAEVDFLFVTALLTTLSFSVHDTIVVFDRIRELQKNGGSFYTVANNALTETMVRSLNNSFTIIFMLVALLLLGGSTIQWFATALLIGTILGTYSSPFVAVPLLQFLGNLKRQK